jgi:hypothetical protein
MTACCVHVRSWHCKVGASGFWICEGRFKKLVRCRHSSTFAEDDRATCTGSHCAVPGCECTGWPERKPRKKKQEQSA